MRRTRVRFPASAVLCFVGFFSFIRIVVRSKCSHNTTMLQSISISSCLQEKWTEVHEEYPSLARAQRIPSHLQLLTRFCVQTTYTIPRNVRQEIFITRKGSYTYICGDKRRRQLSSVAQLPSGVVGNRGALGGHRLRRMPHSLEIPDLPRKK